jgi:hypothetical protein
MLQRYPVWNAVPGGSKIKLNATARKRSDS